MLAEASRAVKCPSIGAHLAGCKKVQQVLGSAPGVLERFLPPSTYPGQAQAVRDCFVGLWPLDAAGVSGDPRAAAAVAAAAAHPERFVMKPQREGGGNNVYGGALAAALCGGLTPEQRAAYILMERVFPAPAPTWFVRAGSGSGGSGVAALPAVSELGVYSVWLSDGGSDAGGGARAPPLLNAPAGHLLRTKVDGTDEGGVAAGFAVLDSPLLTDE